MSGLDPGLCPRCAHVKLVRNERGSIFLLCRLASRDASYPKYPSQPRRVCPGFEAGAEPPGADSARKRERGG